MTSNTEVFNFIDKNGNSNYNVDINTDEIFDPLMQTNVSIKDYLTEIIESGTNSDNLDKTIIIVLFNSDGSEKIWNEYYESS